jgi:hypothetical protein
MFKELSIRDKIVMGAILVGAWAHWVEGVL